jgi:hypothetical protein
MSGRRLGDEAQELDQRHANEAMRRLREEHALDGNNAEAAFDFALRYVRLEEEAARAREESTGLRRDKGTTPSAK